MTKSRIKFAMHELSLTEDLYQIIQEKAREDGFSRVEKILLEIGELSHVTEDAMRFCFSSVMKGSCAEDADLEIIPVAGVGECTQCGTTGALHHYYDPCESCGAFGLSVVAGDRVRIKALEVV